MKHSHPFHTNDLVNQNVAHSSNSLQLSLAQATEIATDMSPMSSKVETAQLDVRSHLGKRTFDLLICVGALPLVLIVFVIIMAAIWVEDGHNPFFFQLRTGFLGKRFRMYKFRTMVPNAEALKNDLMHLNELQWPDFKIKNDPRITRVGKFLRRTSLDELPQLINVLIGNMSLVGPRPTSFKPETYQAWHMKRLEALPGLTGLWQVSGRSNLEFDERVCLDIEYIENQNVFYDIYLLCKTVDTALLKREGAY